MSKIIKILYVPSLNTPVYYWRIENYANALVKFKDRCAVHVVYLTPIESNFAWDKLCIGFGENSDMIQNSLEAAFRFYDVIIFQKIQNKEGLALIREYKKRFPWVYIVAELDDAIGDVPPSNIHYEKFKDHHTWSSQHIFMSDAIITSTDYLKQSMINLQAEYFDELKIVERNYKPIHVAPNCIDKDSWHPEVKIKKRDNLRIGYVAGSGHDEDLMIAYRAMLPLMEMNKKITFVVRYGGMAPYFMKSTHRIDFKRVNWHISKYAQELVDLDLDLALAPLRDTTFNRCKSNLRWLEFASLGCPVVASKIEPFIKTKGKVWLADNDIKSYTESIEQCINSVKLNKQMISEQLKKDCFENYNIENEAGKVLDFLESL